MRCTPYIMQSNCGVDTVRSARQILITMVESGPPVASSAALGLIKSPAIAIDIGGTTPSALITGGEAGQYQLSHRARETRRAIR